MKTSSSRKHKLLKIKTDIPDDIFFYEFLPRLRTKTLVKFKTVCRKWNTKISSFEFAHCHLRRLSPLWDSVLTHVRIKGKKKAKFYNTLMAATIDYERGKVFNDSLYGVMQFSYTFNCLLASCNGLALFISSPRQCECNNLATELPACVHHYDFRYVVCNPLLGINGGNGVGFLEIDHPSDILLGGTKRVVKNDLLYNFGFGYVSLTSDYCIFVVNLPRNPGCPDVVVHVYSIRSQEWKIPLRFKQRMLPLKFREPWYERSGILVKKTLYWSVTRGKDDHCIAAFDLSRHQYGFKVMKLRHPNLGGGAREYSAVHLCCMDGCLCACATNVAGNGIAVWKMEGHDRLYGSWTEIFRINFDMSNLCCRNVFGLSWTRENLIFTCNDRKLSYVDFGLDQLHMETALKNIYNAVYYVRSLVSVPALLDSQRREG